MAAAPNPLHAFRFQVTFQVMNLPETSGSGREIVAGFSEITGLEATVEPLAISEGGLNWGQRQRPGRTTFSTVIFKRGVTENRLLWSIFKQTHADRAYKSRLSVTILLKDIDDRSVLRWRLDSALPVKMKLTDMNATGADIGIEELHLVHEGITEELPS